MTMAGYNLTRSGEELLERHKSSPPSFSVHLHTEHWTLNNGIKFLYNNQVASLLEDIRAHRIPVDFLELFDSAKVPFYDGCMIVELVDHRRQRNKDPPPPAEGTRVVLHPNSETLWADLCLLNQKAGNKWTDNDALQVEARILVATAPPLCLDPDPHVTRIANQILRVSTPAIPVSLKRKAATLDPEEDETDKARRAKIMQFMNPRPLRTHGPSNRILEAIHRTKMVRLVDTGQPPHSGAAMPAPPTHTSAPPPNEDETKQLPRKKEGSKPPYVDAPNSVPPQTIIAPYHARAQPNQISPQKSPPNLQPQQQLHATIQNRPGDTSKGVGSPRVPHSPQVPPPQPPHHNQQPQAPLPAFQTPVLPAHFLNQTTGPRNGQSKASTAATPNSQPQPQSNVHNATNLQMQHHMFTLAGQQPNAGTAAAKQRLHPGGQNGINGRSTPQLPHPPLPRNLNPSPNPSRSSPRVPNGTPSSHSPASQDAQAIPPQMNHPPQHLTFQNHFGPAHLRPVMHNNLLSSQGLPAHIINSVTQPTPSPGPGQQQVPQDQGHPTPMYPPHMFNYHMGTYPMPPGRMHQGYGWGIGRGIPGVVNGQHSIPPNNGHPQQMPLGVGKAGGVQR